MFPLIYLTDGNSLLSLVSLGSMRQTNTFFTVQALLAMMFLGSKCWYLMSELDPAYIEYCHYKQLQKIEKGIYNYYDKKPWIITKQWIKYITRQETIHLVNSLSNSPEMSQIPPHLPDIPTKLSLTSKSSSIIEPFDDKLKNTLRHQIHKSFADINPVPEAALSQSRSSNNGDDLSFPAAKIDDISANDDKKDQNSNKLQLTKSQNLRKLFVLLVAFLLFGTGLTVLVSFVLSIENSYKTQCLSPIDDTRIVINTGKADNFTWMAKDPEVRYFYQSYCKKRAVYIFSDYPCNCRQLRVPDAASSLELNLNLLESAFENWTMLEGISLHAVELPVYEESDVILTHNMFKNLKYVRILDINGFNIGSIDDGIGKYLNNLGMSNLVALYNYVYIVYQLNIVNMYAIYPIALFFFVCEF